MCVHVVTIDSLINECPHKSSFEKLKWFRTAATVVVTIWFTKTLLKPCLVDLFSNFWLNVGSVSVSDDVIAFS